MIYIREIKFPRAWNADRSEVIDIREVGRTGMVFYCLGCEGRMVARIKDDVKARHFAHYSANGGECACSAPESAIHRNLTYYMYLEFLNCLRSTDRVKHVFRIPVSCHRVNASVFKSVDFGITDTKELEKTKFRLCGLRINYDILKNVADIKWEAGISINGETRKPDISFYDNAGNCIRAIEVVYKHDISDELEKFYSRSKIDVIRVDAKKKIPVAVISTLLEDNVIDGSGVFEIFDFPGISTVYINNRPEIIIYSDWIIDNYRTREKIKYWDALLSEFNSIRSDLLAIKNESICLYEDYKSLILEIKQDNRSILNEVYSEPEPFTPEIQTIEPEELIKNRCTEFENLKSPDFFLMTTDELDAFKRDILDWKSKSSVYKDTNWILSNEQQKRDLMVKTYMANSGISDECFNSISTIFYTLMSRWWKAPGYWGEVGVEGRNMTS